MLAAFGEDLETLIDRSRNFQLWLAGPNPTAKDRVLAAASVEVIGAALAAGTDQTELSDADLRTVLLDAATAVLARRSTPTESKL